MSDFSIALIAASLSTLGSLLTQMFSSKNSRRQTYNEKRLVALLEVRQAVEEAGGRWYAWAKACLGQDSPETCASLEERASEATHDAWYSTRVFEMYFPTMMEASQSMRDEISRRKNEAIRQVEAGGAFDNARFSSNRAVDLDEVVAKARKILGYPSV